MVVLRPDEAGSDFRIAIDERHLQPYGSGHGGVIAGLLDAAMGLAVLGRLPPEEGASTIEMKLNFTSAARPGELSATGQVLHAGRRIVTASAGARRRRAPGGRRPGHLRPLRAAGGRVTDATRLDGRVAVVTGAAGGIGRATAALLIARGARVLLTDRDPAVAAAAAGLGPRADAMDHDVTDPARARAVVGAALGRPRASGRLGQQRGVRPPGAVRRHRGRSVATPRRGELPRGPPRLPRRPGRPAGGAGRWRDRLGGLGHGPGRGLGRGGLRRPRPPWWRSRNRSRARSPATACA
jgi:uncharacterized protein (TIGR00369 family)